jgi:hypothetical protein
MRIKSTRAGGALKALPSRATTTNLKLTSISLALWVFTALSALAAARIRGNVIASFIFYCLLVYCLWSKSNGSDQWTQTLKLCCSLDKRKPQTVWRVPDSIPLLVSPPPFARCLSDANLRSEGGCRICTRATAEWPTFPFLDGEIFGGGSRSSNEL